MDQADPNAPRRDIVDPMALARQLLRQRFGLEHFRGLQAAVIARVLGGQDVLALMPTGAGKSLCYQLPGVMLGGLTLVVSPLIALMRDQQRRLDALGIPSCAFTSALPAGERGLAGSRIAQGELAMLLLSPERVLAPGFLPWLASLCRARPVSLLVVDEAHCIADWGAAFRPVYRCLGELRRWFPGVPMLAMTASADARVQDEILRTLAMPPEAVLRASLDRPELFYRVAPSALPARAGLAYLQHHHPGASAIFYCRRRWQTHALAAFLRAHGVPAMAYHAGQPADLRRDTEARFQRQPGAVVAATIAFGMGIDKADVRLVVHLGTPAGIAAYYQESGRAGRDGQPADALLLVPEVPTGIAIDDGDESLPARDAQHASAAAMSDYVEGPGCRRARLLAAFGEQAPANCSACDHCRPAFHPMPGPRSLRLPWVPPARGGKRRQR